MAFLVLLGLGSAGGETVGAYLTQGGHYTQGFDFNLGFLSSVPQASARAESRFGARVGLSYEPDPIPLHAFRLPLNLALLYATKAVAMNGTRWTFSEAALQVLVHHPVHPRLAWLEPALFISPHYTFDLILSGSGGNIPAGQSLENRFSADAGAGLLLTLSVLQARLYYAQNLIRQAEPTNLTVSSFGADLLLPLSRKRKAP